MGITHQSYFGTWLDEHAKNAVRMASAVHAVASNKPTQELTAMRFLCAADINWKLLVKNGEGGRLK